MKFRYPVFSQC